MAKKSKVVLTLEDNSRCKNYKLQDIAIDNDLKNLMNKATEAMKDNFMGYMQVTTANFVRQAIRYYANLVLTKRIGLVIKDDAQDPKNIVLGTHHSEKESCKNDIYKKQIEEDSNDDEIDYGEDLEQD